VAITTYGELKTAIQTWNPHSDIPSVVDDLIDLAEARLSRELRCRRMVISQTGTLTSGTLAVPTDLLEVVEIRCGSGTSERTLVKRPVVDFHQRSMSQQAGTPEAFVIDGDVFRFGPVPTSSDYTLRYYQKIPALTNAKPTNWLLQDAPDVYLYASLVESERFLRSPEGVLAWETMLTQAKNSLIGSDRRGRYMGGSQRIMAV